MKETLRSRLELGQYRFHLLHELRATVSVTSTDTASFKRNLKNITAPASVLGLQWRSQGGPRGPSPHLPPNGRAEKKIKIDISDFEVSCAFTDALFSSYPLLKDDITVIDLN